MADDKLYSYVKDATDKGIDEARIIARLMQVGYSREDIERALSTSKANKGSAGTSSPPSSELRSQSPLPRNPALVTAVAILIVVIIFAAVTLISPELRYSLAKFGHRIVYSPSQSADLRTLDSSNVTWDQVNANLAYPSYFNGKFGADCLEKTCNWNYLSGYLISNGKRTASEMDEKDSAFLKSKIASTSGELLADSSKMAFEPNMMWYFFWMHAINDYPEGYTAIIAQVAAAKDKTFSDVRSKQLIMEYARADGKVDEGLYNSTKSAICGEYSQYKPKDFLELYDYLTVKRFCGVPFDEADRGDVQSAIRSSTDSRVLLFSKDFPELVG